MCDKEMNFAERIGAIEVKGLVIQSESVDRNLRVSLWNVLYPFCLESIVDSIPIIGLAVDYRSNRFVKEIWDKFLHKPIDELPIAKQDFIKYIKNYIFDIEWYKIYEIIEFILLYDNKLNKSNFILSINEVLQRNNSAYYLVGNNFISIINEVEINEVEQVITDAETRFPSIATHIKTAIRLFSDRNSPDYRNSIKESISAVEAICGIICNDTNLSLGKALKKIEEESGISIHPSLKESFNKLYGYTSDADGIRHALLEESTLDIEDAQCILVSCSAFVNYLIIKAEKSNIFSSELNEDNVDEV